MSGGFLEKTEENHGNMNWEKAETRITLLLLFFSCGCRRSSGKKTTDEHKKIAEFFTVDNSTHREIAEKLVKDEDRAVKLQAALGAKPAWKTVSGKRKKGEGKEGEGEEQKPVKNAKVDEVKKVEVEERKWRGGGRKRSGRRRRGLREWRKQAGVKKPGPKSGRKKPDASAMFKKALAGAKDMERKAKEYGEKAKEKTGLAVAEGEASEEGSGGRQRRAGRRDEWGVARSMMEPHVSAVG